MPTATRIVANLLLALGTAVFMEFVAWATHKYVMHGFLWVLHKDHHHPTGHTVQRNDLFAVFFALISMSLIMVGLRLGLPALPAAGFGMALYGAGYVIFHDIMFHRRIRAIHYRPTSAYMKRIFRAHRVHHRNPGKSPAVSFGFLYAPKRYAEPKAP